MNETKPTKPQLRFDDQGRAIPFSAAERQAQAKAVIRMFEELAKIPDEPGEVSDRVALQAIDRHRPHRPLAGVATTLTRPGDPVVVATTNVRHLGWFPGVDAQRWADIA